MENLKLDLAAMSTPTPTGPAEYNNPTMLTGYDNGTDELSSESAQIIEEGETGGKLQLRFKRK